MRIMKKKVLIVVSVILLIAVSVFGLRQLQIKTAIPQASNPYEPDISYNDSKRQITKLHGTPDKIDE